MEDEELLTINEAAAMLDIHPASVYQAIREGRLPSIVKYGRKVIHPADLEAYRQRTRPQGEKPRGRPRRQSEESAS